MKTSFLALAILVAAFSSNSLFAQSTDKLNPGDALPAPGKMLRNANGSTISLHGSMGKNGLLVMFSCNTCPFVIKNEGMTKKTMEYAASHNIGMVIFNSNEAKRGDDDSYDAMVKFAKTQQYTVPYLVDESSAFADMFGANHTPEIFLFDNKGKLAYKGAMNDNPGDPSSYKKMYIEDAINAVVAGKPVNPKTTKSVGCSIKRKA
jgi:thioredoxin-related protein